MTWLPRSHLASVPQFAAYDRDIRKTDSESLPLFIRLSVELTGFSEAELAATGLAKNYFEELGQVLGVSVREDLLASKLAPDAMMASPRYGPLARNLIRLWYLAQWKQLPCDWVAQQLTNQERKDFDEFGRNTNRVLSSQAYKQGLAWAAIGSNPPGAKQPGFGSWAEPP
jgi:hypothetical protein